MKYLNLEFGDSKTVIELNDSTIAQKWVEVFLKYKENNIDYKIERNKAIIHQNQIESEIHPVYNVSKEDCITFINTAIDKVNQSIKGTPFPYRAFIGMPWAQTNRLHRCFTTGIMSYRFWYHKMTTSELYEFKKINYSSKGKYINTIKHSDYEVLNKELFLENLEYVNKWIHVYESFFANQRTKNLVNEINGTADYLELTWDNFLPSGEKSSSFEARVTYEEIKQSFGKNYFDNNVFLCKSIAGKDYEFAFCEYDDGLEYDITNLDQIDGGIRLHFEPGIEQLYKSSTFTKWCEDLGISRELYLPIPIGKIVENTADFSKASPNNYTEERLTNGCNPLLPPFNSVKSYITEEF
jgi:hypothetical protein